MDLAGRAGVGPAAGPSAALAAFALDAASFLLLEQAVRDGDMPPETACRAMARLRLGPGRLPEAGELPREARAVRDEAQALAERLRPLLAARLDARAPDDARGSDARGPAGSVAMPSGEPSGEREKPRTGPEGRPRLRLVSSRP